MALVYYILAYIQHNGDVSLEEKKSVLGLFRLQELKIIPSEYLE